MGVGDPGLCLSTCLVSTRAPLRTAALVAARGGGREAGATAAAAALQAWWDGAAGDIVEVGGWMLRPPEWWLQWLPYGFSSAWPLL